MCDDALHGTWFWLRFCYDASHERLRFCCDASHEPLIITSAWLTSVSDRVCQF